MELKCVPKVLNIELFKTRTKYTIRKNTLKLKTVNSNRFLSLLFANHGL